MTADAFHFQQGRIPLLISIPHLGTEIPADVRSQLTDAASETADTDWHLDRLYDFALRAGASMLGARYSRYVIDLNRPASGESLYPGQTTTGLCPTETFRGVPLYREGGGPQPHEVQRRLEAYWKPYHAKLREELDRLRAQFGAVLLWEAHSIASVLPRLFDDKLPDLNIGTQDGRTADASIQARVESAAKASGLTWVANGRFKGGYITRHFGAPKDGVHAVQLEMCQSAYMNESAPFDFVDERAGKVEAVLRDMLRGALDAVKAIG